VSVVHLIVATRSSGPPDSGKIIKEMPGSVASGTPYIFETFTKICGPGQLSQYSNSLQAERSGDQIAVGASFSALVQTGPGAHPASYTMGTGSFQGVKQPGCFVDHPPRSNAEVKEGVQLYLYSPFGPSWPVTG
jgi:hypothetical protein